MGRTMRFIKVKAHSGEPLNEAANALAAAAAETDPAGEVEQNLDPEAVPFLFKGKWVEWDVSFREDLTQKAAEQCLSRILRPKRRRGGQEAVPPALPLTASWMLRPDQGRSTLGQVLKTMKIGSAKKQVLQSIAGAFPCNALLHKEGLSAKLTSIGPTSMARATPWVSTRHGGSREGTHAARPVGTDADGQSGRPRLLWLVNLRSVILGRIHLIGICHSGEAPLRRVVIGYRCGIGVIGLSESRFASGPWVGRCAFWLLHGRTAAQVALRHRDCLPATLNASSKATPPFRRGG